MIDGPDIGGQNSKPEKLVLPAIPETDPRLYTDPVKTIVRPEQLVRLNKEPLPKGPLAKLGYFWRKDPAYKVLILALVMVLLAGIVLVSVASAALLQMPNLLTQNNTASSNPTAGPATSGTVNLHPSFPTPGGGSGGNSSSQPPAQSTPVVQPTANPTVIISPTAAPEPSPTSQSGGPLNVEITNIPSSVGNNSSVRVGVTTNEANVSIRLSVTYNAPPFFYNSAPRMTDGDGNVTLFWYVHVYRFAGSTTATVVAVATDSNGQQAQSAPMEVQIFSGGEGV